MAVDPAASDGTDEFGVSYAEEEYQQGEPGRESVEVPEADAAEQRTELLPPDTPLPPSAPPEADPADTAEQARVVDPGDDEYR